MNDSPAATLNQRFHPRHAHAALASLAFATCLGLARAQPSERYPTEAHKHAVLVEYQYLEGHSPGAAVPLVMDDFRATVLDWLRESDPVALAPHFKGYEGVITAEALAQPPFQVWLGWLGSEYAFCRTRQITVSDVLAAPEVFENRTSRDDPYVMEMNGDGLPYRKYDLSLKEGLLSLSLRYVFLYPPGKPIVIQAVYMGPGVSASFPVTFNRLRDLPSPDMKPGLLREAWHTEPWYHRKTDRDQKDTFRHIHYFHEDGSETGKSEIRVYRPHDPANGWVNQALRYRGEFNGDLANVLEATPDAMRRLLPYLTLERVEGEAEDDAAYGYESLRRHVASTLLMKFEDQAVPFLETYQNHPRAGAPVREELGNRVDFEKVNLRLNTWLSEIGTPRDMTDMEREDANRLFLRFHSKNRLKYQSDNSADWPDEACAEFYVLAVKMAWIHQDQHGGWPWWHPAKNKAKKILEKRFSGKSDDPYGDLPLIFAMMWAKDYQASVQHLEALSEKHPALAKHVRKVMLERRGNPNSQAYRGIEGFWEVYDQAQKPK